MSFGLPSGTRIEIRDASAGIVAVGLPDVARPVHKRCSR